MSVNIEEATASIASDLFPNAEPEQAEQVEQVEQVEQAEQPEQAEEKPVEQTVRAVPKSWAKEMHEHWGKVAPEVQEYIELREKQMLDGLEQYKQHNEIGRKYSDIVKPYEPVLRADNIDPTKAVEYLMNAHYKLRTLQGDQKIAYLGQIAQTYGIDLNALMGRQPQQQNPEIDALKRELAELKGGMTQAQQRAFENARAKISKDVDAFADAKDDKGNPLHPYFDDVSNDVIVYLNAGHELQDAYDKAVWANPVTRAKEQARLQKEADAKRREQSTKEAREAQRAASTNVRSLDTKRAPTEPLGKMEDTMKETLREIRERTH